MACISGGAAPSLPPSSLLPEAAALDIRKDSINECGLFSFASQNQAQKKCNSKNKRIPFATWE
jgi:hypothetical protein